MSLVKHVLVDKKKAFTFQAGQQFVIKVAKSVVARIFIKASKADTSALYAVVAKSEGSMYLEVKNLFNNFYGMAIYQVVEEPTTPVFGVIKTPEERDLYIVWSPGSRQPPQQLFVSAKQARFVAYRMSEQHKGEVFHWAKVEGHSQRGQLPDPSVE